MDSQEQVRHNPACPDRGQSGRGNIGIHSRKEQRYRCSTCGWTFAATTGTPFYRQRTVTEVVTVVLTLLCSGCLLKAIGAAFGFDERTVRAWQARASEHWPGVHEDLVHQGRWVSVMCRPLYRRPAYGVC
jgi:transposase-like protein